MKTERSFFLLMKIMLSQSEKHYKRLHQEWCTSAGRLSAQPYLIRVDNNGSSGRPHILAVPSCVSTQETSHRRREILFGFQLLGDRDRQRSTATTSGFLWRWRSAIRLFRLGLDTIALGLPVWQVSLEAQERCFPPMETRHGAQY